MNKDDLSNFIVDNQNYIYSIVNKYKNYAEVEDLYQVAIMGIIKASHKFNTAYNVKFTTYAYTYIIGEINHFLNKNRQIKISKEYLAIYKQIIKAKNILTQKLMKEPNSFELSIFLEIDEKTINNVIQMVSSVDSLDRTISSDGKDLSLYDTIDISCIDNEINYIDLKEEINKLDEQSRILIEERYFQDKTQSETAAILGINQVQVSRNEQKVLKLLKNKLQEVA